VSIDLHKPFTNPISKETFRCLSFTPDAYTMEWIVEPGGYVPFEHIHPNQDEIFHVQAGEGRIVIDGQEHIGEAGQTLTVPKGARHIAYNNKPETLTCIVEYRPGLDHYQLFQCFAGLTLDGEIDAKGSINIPKMGYFLKKINAQALTRPTSVPKPLFGLLLNMFYFVGTLAGWEKQFRQYTGE